MDASADPPPSDAPTWPERDPQPADFIGALRDVVFRTRGKAFWSYLSPAWESLTGYTVEESLGRNILDFVFPDDRPANSLLKQQLESGQRKSSRHVKRLQRKDGRSVWIEVDLRVLEGADGSFQGSVGTIRDISDRVALEEAIGHERELASVTLMALSDGVLTLDRDNCVEFLNHAAADMLGLEQTSDALDRPIETVLALEAHDVLGLLDAARSSGQPRTLGGRCRLRSAGADWVDVDLSVIPLRDASNGAVVVLRDVREQRALQARLSHQARHDALTQTLNRTGMLEELRRVHVAYRRSGAGFCEILMDLDHFKLVNDYHGHAAGDEALRQVAQAVRGALRVGDVLARWGGEEFLCLLPHTTLEAGVGIAERIRHAVAALDLQYGGQAIALTLSAGVSAAASGGDDTLEQVLQRADFALYEAKQAGRNRVWHERQSGLGALGLVSRVQEALRSDRLDVAYQPIVSLHSGERVGHEGFARVRLDDGPALPAKRFMPALQQLHRAHRIDEQVIPRVLRDCAAGRIEGLCFINVSADLLRQPALMAEVFDGFLQRHADAGAQPLRRLVLELGSRPLQLDVGSVADALQPWLHAGAQLALNQSGAGMSGMGYWIELPIRFLKIHAQLLGLATGNEKARRILTSMVDLARQLDCQPIAEQVDQPEQAVMARQLGIDWVQGDLFGAALTSD